MLPLGVRRRQWTWWHLAVHLTLIVVSWAGVILAAYTVGLILGVF